MNSDARRPLVVDVISIFPEMFAAITASGVTRRALAEGIWEFFCHNPRDFADNAYRTVDDRPYGGGPGMVMQAPPLAQAIAAARARQAAGGGSTGRASRTSRTICLSPQGQPLTDRRVRDLAAQAGEQGLILLCGRYEGIDERLLAHAVDEEISIGDFVLSGGEIPAMALIDAIVRQLPGALNDARSAEEDSFVAGLLDCPHYTRPEEFLGRKVPDVLLSGHHAEIRRWRLKQSLGRTWQRRPDMLAQRAARQALTKEETQLLAEYQSEQEQCGQEKTKEFQNESD